ncbi:Uncharacterised protein [Chlamydia trachomatis]|nr:Uncharacterised protein [Chlamydia trachomatis]
MLRSICTRRLLWGKFRTMCRFHQRITGKHKGSLCRVNFCLSSLGIFKNRACGCKSFIISLLCFTRGITIILIVYIHRSIHICNKFAGIGLITIQDGLLGLLQSFQGIVELFLRRHNAYSCLWLTCATVKLIKQFACVL